MFKNIKVGKLVLILIAVTIVAFAAAAAALVSEGLFNTTDFSIGFSKNMETRSVDFTETFDIGDVSRIDLCTISSPINIIDGEGTEMRIHFYGEITTNVNNLPVLRANKSRGVIKAKVKRGNRGVSLFTTTIKSNLKFDVYLPREYTGELKVDTTSADLHMDTREFSETRFDTVSGSLKAESITTGSFRMDSTSGDLLCDVISDKAVVNTTSGNIKSDVFITGSTRIDSVSGDFMADLFEGDLRFESVSGNAKLSYDNFDNNITIDTVSGDVDIALPVGSEFEIDFDSTSGDVSLKGFAVNIINGKSNKFSGTVGKGGKKIVMESVSGDLKITSK